MGFVYKFVVFSPKTLQITLYVGCGIGQFSRTKLCLFGALESQISSLFNSFLSKYDFNSGFCKFLELLLCLCAPNQLYEYTASP